MPRPAALAPPIAKRRVRFPVLRLTTFGLVLALLATLTLGGMTFGQAALARRDASPAPRVVVLGSGSSLSVLILAGRARVLIAAGDDPQAFGTAFGSAVSLSGKRIDVMIVAATGKQLAVPIDLAHGDDIRQVVRLGPPHPAPETGDLPLGLAQVPADARVSVAPGVTATIHTVLVPKDSGRSFALAWRAEIRHGSGTITVLSDSAYADQFPPLTSTGVLVVARGDDFTNVLPMTAGALVLGNDATTAEIRAAVPGLIAAPLPLIRVADGAAVTLPLRDDGVALPHDAVTVMRPAA